MSGGFRLMIDPLAKALRLGLNMGERRAERRGELGPRRGDGPAAHKARQLGLPKTSPATTAPAAAAGMGPLAAATPGRSDGRSDDSSGRGSTGAAHVFANTVFFGERGEYAGFDASEFTASDGGKRRALAHLRASRPGLRLAAAAPPPPEKRVHGGHAGGVGVKKWLPELRLRYKPHICLRG